MGISFIFISVHEFTFHNLSFLEKVRHSTNVSVIDCHIYKISIHPSIRGQVAEVAVPAGFPKLPFSWPHQLALTGGSRDVPRPVWRYSPSTWSLVYPVASSQLDVPGTPPGGCDQVASLLDARTTSMAPFYAKGQRF